MEEHFVLSHSMIRLLFNKQRRATGIMVKLCAAHDLITCSQDLYAPIAIPFALSLHFSGPYSDLLQN